MGKACTADAGSRCSSRASILGRSSDIILWSLRSQPLLRRGPMAPASYHCSAPMQEGFVCELPEVQPVDDLVRLVGAGVAVEIDGEGERGARRPHVEEGAAAADLRPAAQRVAGSLGPRRRRGRIEATSEGGDRTALEG